MLLKSCFVGSEVVAYYKGRRWFVCGVGSRQRGEHLARFDLLLLSIAKAIDKS